MILDHNTQGVTYTDCECKFCNTTWNKTLMIAKIEVDGETWCNNPHLNINLFYKLVKKLNI